MISIFTIFLFILLSNNLLQAQGLYPFGLQNKIITSLAVENIDYDSRIPPSNYIFAGTEEDGVFRALADDETPEWILFGLDSIPISALTVQHWGAGPIDGLTLYAGLAPDYEHGDSSSILRREVKLSLDTNWIVSDSGFDKSGGIFTLNSYYYTGHTPPGKILAGEKSGIYHESNNIWIQSEIEAGNPYILAIDVAPHWWGNLAWAAGHYGLATNITPLVLRSMDQGLTWKQFAPADYLSASATSIAINQGPNFGVFLYSTNGGKDWQYSVPVVDMLLDEVTSIAVFKKPDDDSGYVFIGTAGTGVWVYKYSTLTGITEEKNIPGQFSLFQNYPNPFNPTTHFGFRIADFPAGGGAGVFVSLKIYDVLGNEVAVLVNEEKSPGKYETEFNAGGLSSGIYFYRLQAGSFSDTKKLILLK